MRREGYEFAVSKPEVLYHTDERGKKLEPMEIAYVDVPEEFSGTVIQKLSERKGELQGMSTARWFCPPGIPYPVPWTDRFPWRVPYFHQGYRYPEYNLRWICSIQRRFPVP